MTSPRSWPISIAIPPGRLPANPTLFRLSLLQPESEVDGLCRAGDPESIRKAASARLSDIKGPSGCELSLSTFTTATFTVMMATLPLPLLIALQDSAPVWLCWIVFGFFGSGSILYYAALSQRFPGRIAGRVNTALNLLVFVGAFGLQWGIGVVIDYWPAGKEFSAAGYRVAFMTVVALQALALLWYLFFRGQEAVQAPRAGN